MSELHHVCDTADLAPGKSRAYKVAGADGATREIAIVRTWEGDFFAIEDRCSHGDVSLADGDVEGCTIECWGHGSRFDLRTGEPLNYPAVEPVAVYPVSIDGARVLVDIGRSPRGKENHPS